MRLNDGGVAQLGQALGALLDKSVPPARRADAAQEALDVAAVVAGLKPVAIVGCAYDGEGWIESMQGVLTRFCIPAEIRGCWIVAPEIAGLPSWYMEPMRRTHAAMGLLHASTPGQTVALLEKTDLTTEEEARLLGYPACCVEDHHGRRRIFHRLMVALIRRRAGPSRQSMRRLAESEIVLRPARPEERSRLEEALRCVPAAYTSVNMCPACSTCEDSPARQMSQRYQRVARLAHLERHLCQTDVA